MIYQRGTLTPTKAQLAEARARADSTFTSRGSSDFCSRLPAFEGYRDADSLILLKLRNVVPHSDDWVSEGKAPRVRRALFWLLQGGGNALHERLTFGCGKQHITMAPGDFVIFNDSVDHWVMSEKTWLGAAAQLIGVTNSPAPGAKA